MKKNFFNIFCGILIMILVLILAHFEFNDNFPDLKNMLDFIAKINQGIKKNKEEIPKANINQEDEENNDPEIVIIYGDENNNNPSHYYDRRPQPVFVKPIPQEEYEKYHEKTKVVIKE